MLMLYILTKYHYWILKHPSHPFLYQQPLRVSFFFHWEILSLCVEIKISKFYFHQNDLRIKCNPVAPRRVINPAWNMDLMGGKSLQITFFKLLNYKSRDTNWFFVPVSLWFINIFGANYIQMWQLYCCCLMKTSPN